MTTFLSIVVYGTVVGSVYGIAALGLVLTYRISGVFNFGHGAIAMFAAYVYFQLNDLWGWNAVLSAVVVVCILAPAFGWLLDRVMFRPLAGGPVVVRIVATAGIFIVLVALAGLVWKGKGRGITPIFPRHRFTLPGGVVMTTEQLGILLVAAAVSFGLYALLRYTRLGVTMRAVVDDRDLAELHRIDSSRVSAIAWALGSALAALAGVLIAPILTLDTYTLPLITIAAYAAAVIAYLRNLPGTIAAAVSIGIADQAIALQARSATLIGLRPSLPFIALFFVLVGRSFVIPKIRGRTPQVASEGPALPDFRSPPPTPARRVVVLALIVMAVVLPPMMSARNRFLLVVAATNALTALSLVLLTGHSGQISLGQLTFASAGAFAFAHLAGRAGVPYLVALVIAALAAVPIGAVIAVLASRLLGLYLALATLALAIMADQFVSNILSITGGPSGLAVPRPSFARSDLAFYYLCCAVLALVVPATRNILRGRTGRILAAMRDSETAAKTTGIDLFRYKVIVFSLSAFLAGLAGALSASLQGVAVMSNFNPIISIFFLSAVVIAGITRPAGALVAGLLTAFGGESLGAYAPLLFGVIVVVLLLARAPQGLIALVRPRDRSPWIDTALRRYRGETAHSGVYR